ncbi:HTTM domain-containing protein [Hymenobacter jejuensis]|uniref:HTTM domain-containing protein n=1 Tax=Hymenobacter jejuensis TaxID=2502781 RepID=A0A5B8A258_9BACT|nr:HTTM domain-containing protein [Hymenobacter jejuensis]QDA61229.1 HTTM domain-containing protein [Hymenobacter jejuensis]
MLPRALAFIRRPFVVDLRALAMLRAGIATVILIDLVIRSTDLEAHYSNMGVLPLQVLYEHVWNPYMFSLHTISGLWQVQAVLFLLSGAFAVALLVGYKTRLSTILAWIMLVSVQNRNVLIGQGGDDLLRMLLFWGIFLPWGRVYSVDSKDKPLPETYNYFSPATVAYIVQIALVYWCTALLKSAPEWSKDGTAIYYALSLDQVLMPGGKLIYPYPMLLKYMTLGVYYTEMLIPFALFIPFRVTWWRLLFVTVIFFFHLGISLTLFVGLFFLINWASILGLLPPLAINWLEDKLLPRAKRLGPQLARLRPHLPAWRLPVQIRFEATVHHTNESRELLRYVRDTFVSVLLVYVCWWNLDSIANEKWLMSDKMRWFGYLFRTDQHWGMFAPAVFKDDGWYILDGITPTGQHIDLNRKGRPTTEQKPRSVMRLFKNDRWRKYSENYLFIDNMYMRPYYCNYLLRIWNEDKSHPPVNHLDVIYMKEVTQPDYKPVVPTHENLCSCEVPTPIAPPAKVAAGQ